VYLSSNGMGSIKARKMMHPKHKMLPNGDGSKLFSPENG
jgi:hypothetical protein